MVIPTIVYRRHVSIIESPNFVLTLYLLKSELRVCYNDNLLIFTGNHANHGGAVYVADEDNYYSI